MRLSLAPILFALLATAGCDTFPRRLAYATVPSPAMRGVWMQYAVYAPDDLREDEHLPLVVFLHGGGDGPDCLDRAGIGTAIDEAMRAGEIPRAVIVVPEGDLGFWANWYDGSRHYEDWVMNEVIPRVASSMHTTPCPEGCHVMGVSMGAEGAVRFAVHHPDGFASITSISGPALDTERRIAFVNDPINNIFIPTWHVFGPPRPRSRIEADDPYLVWTSAADLHSARLYLAWGTEDREFVRTGAEAFDAHLTAHEIPHTRVVYEGRHGWTWWRPVILAALRAQLSPE